MKRNTLYTILFFIVVILANITFSRWYHRFDLTSEKRYSISENTKNLIRGAEKDIHIKIYLDGELNSGFLRFKKAIKEMLDEFKAYDKNRKLSYEFINPSEANSKEERNKNYTALEARGIKATVVYDTDNEGEMIQKIIFPWAEFSGEQDSTLLVNLLKNIPGYDGEENINASIEALEYELTDALRTISSKQILKIAFLEGNNELPEENVYDITHAFSRYYQIDRGKLGNSIEDLDPYKVIIIAGPQSKFSESDKFIIDQYIMNGGKVLWLIDGTSHISMDSLQVHSSAIALPQNINLDDQLFRYGVRINPNLVQDMQCCYIPVNVARAGEKSNFQPVPWHYSPLLLTSPMHPVSKNITPVKAEFASTIDFVGEDSKLKRAVLLATSAASSTVQTPVLVDLSTVNTKKTPEHFSARHLPVAVSLEGIFPSVFTNRLIPKEIEPSLRFIRTESKPTRMIVIANSAIIKNGTIGVGENQRAIPLGYDRYMNQQFGNKDFILNAVNYLADDEGWMELRSRELKIRLLDKSKISIHNKRWQCINVAGPLVILLIFGIINALFRKKKYRRFVQ